MHDDRSRTTRVSAALRVLFAVMAMAAGPGPHGPAAASPGGPAPVPDAAALHLALEKLTVMGSVLYVAAHPDDENTAMLTWLENEKLVRAGYLSLTRGDGGQNLIGNEQGDLLGVIRTQELLAARRVDGAEQFFTRAVDFGYSTNPEETLAKWGHDAALSDVVRVIRAFRPDVMIMRFPTTGEGRHGHHTASALLAVEAFDAAADPARFPDQVAAGLAPWKPKRILWNYFNWMQPPSPDSVKALGLVTIDLGAYNPLLGRSYTELAGESRSMHKSQGFGSAERRGPSVNYFKLIAGDPVKQDIFEGVDLSWGRVPGGAAVGRMLTEAHQRHDPSRPEATLPRLVEARKALARLRATPAAQSYDVLLAHKAAEIDEAIRATTGLWLEAIATAANYAPGDSLQVNVTAINRSAAALRLGGIASPVEGLSARADTALASNQPVTVTLKTVAPPHPSWPETQPYWLRDPADGTMHRVADPALIGTPENAPALSVTATILVAGERIDFVLPVWYRWVDRVRGEIYRPVALVPQVTLALDRKVYLFPDATARPVRLRLEARRAVRGTAALTLPEGWRSEPAELALDLAAGESREVAFQVTPGVAGSPVRASFRTDGGTFTRGMTVIDHEHIPIETLFPEAAAKVLRIDLAHAGRRVGYVMGPGDEVAAALTESGYDVTLLDDNALAGGDLAGYDAVVVGVRAFNSRDALKKHAKRLLEYVERGGTMVVQYNTADATLLQDFAPYRLKLGRDRVTVEEAPVSFTDAASPLLTAPNRIGPADFDGWVQERGLYFASEWAPEFRTVLSSNDPGEKPLEGGLLWARYGKGIFVYTGYAFFRQLPAGVPGAYRLFVNLVSARG